MQLSKPALPLEPFLLLFLGVMGHSKFLEPEPTACLLLGLPSLHGKQQGGLEYVGAFLVPLGICAQSLSYVSGPLIL